MSVCAYSRSTLPVWMLALLMVMGFATAALAQPAAGTGLQYTVYVKGDNGVNEAITVIRDALRNDIWYYAAAKPRVAVNENGPMFVLTKFQMPDPDDRSKLVEGANVQFAVRLDPTAAAMAALKPEVVKLAQKLGFPTEIRLSPLPYKKIKLWTFSGKGDPLVTAAPEQKEVTTGFASSEIPFSLSLSRLGADLYADLTSGATGIPVWCEYTYSSIAPPVGFEVTVDYKQSFSYLSKSANTTAAIGCAGVGLGFAVDKDTVRDTLTKNGCLKVKMIGRAGGKESDLNRYLDPILRRIYDELYDSPNSGVTGVNPQALQSPSPSLGDPVLAPLKPSSAVVQFKTSFKLKKVSAVRTDQQVISMMRPLVEEARGGCGGFIGIGPFLAKNPELRDKLIVTAPQGDWPEASLVLPKMTGVRELGVTEVALAIAIFDNEGQVPGDGVQQAARWGGVNSDNDWHQQPGNTTRTSLNFPMASLYEKYRDQLEVLKYRIEAKLTVKARSGVKTITITRFVPVVNGDMPVASPLSYLDIWRVNCEALPWDGEGLTQVTATLVDPLVGRQQAIVTATSADKRPAFLIPTPEPGKASSVTASIQYVVNKKTIQSSLNKLTDVRNQGPELVLVQEWETATGSGKP